jgi:hypothetical protein
VEVEAQRVRAVLPELAALPELVSLPEPVAQPQQEPQAVVASVLQGQPRQPAEVVEAARLAVLPVPEQPLPVPQQPRHPQSGLPPS